MSRTVEQIQFAPRMPKPLRVAAYARVSSGKDAMRLCRRFKTAESLQPVLDRLCEYGYLAAKPQPPAHGAGRKPSEVYLTNPAVLEDGNGEGRS